MIKKNGRDLFRVADYEVVDFDLGVEGFSAVSPVVVLSSDR
jgi:hypothetical protein